MKIKNPFTITGIGSVPHKSEREACDAVFSSFGKIPFWPQLVKKSFREDMLCQYTERMPGIVADTDSGRVVLKRNPRAEIEAEELKKRYEDGELDYFSMSEDYASGFYEYLYRLKSRDLSDTDYLKGQITGPVSLTFGIYDTDGVPLYFDAGFREAAVKTLEMRARWQALKLKGISKDVIIFIDEPTLAFFKNTAKNSRIKKEDLAVYINRIASAIHAEGCYAGMHCCADADWNFALSTDIDIISFDSFKYAQGFLESFEAIKRFLERGGIIAWGMVPTTADSVDTEAGVLAGMLGGYFKRLEEKGLEGRAIRESSLITPSCGCGALGREEAEKVFGVCSDLSSLAQEEIL